MKLLPTFAAFALATAGLAGPALAQERAIALSGDVKVEKVTIAENGERTAEWVAPEITVPGDRLLFSTDYTNRSSEQVTGFVVTNPLPKAVRLAPDAAADLEVSVDGGENWGPLAAQTVAAEDGSSRAATHEDVTHVRWTLAVVEPGASGRVEYHAIIR